MGLRNRRDACIQWPTTTHAHSPVYMDHDSLWIRLIQRETQWVHLLNASYEEYTAAGYPNILH